MRLRLFFPLACGISWLVWLPLYAPRLGWHGLPVLPLNHALGALGPLLASLVLHGFYGGKDGVLGLMRACGAWRPPRFSALALGAPFALWLAAALASRWMNGTPVDFRSLAANPEFPGLGFAALFAYNLLFFGFGEEAGWRGFALPSLLQSRGPVRATLILAAGWAFWHLPLFLYRPGYLSMGWVGVLGWGTSLLTGAVLLTWFYRASRGSVLACALFHSSVDVVFTAHHPDAMIVNALGFLISVWGAVAAIRMLMEKPVSSGTARR